MRSAIRDEEVVDRGELLGGVAVDLVGGGSLERIEQRLDGGHPLGDDFDDDPSAVGRVGDASDVARLLEPVDEPGDRARGQAHDLGELAGRGRPGVDQELEGVDVGLGEAQSDGDGLAEDRALEVDPSKRPDDAFDALSLVHVDNVLLCG